MLKFIAIIATALLVANKAMAQSRATVSVIVPYNTNETLTGSVVGANPTGTTYGIPEVFTVGPSTYEATATNSVTFSVHCDFTGTTRMVCVSKSHSGTSSGSVTETFTPLYYQTLLVTKGAELLSIPTGVQSAGGTSSSTTGSTGARSTGATSVPTSGTTAGTSSPTASSKPSLAAAGLGDLAKWKIAAPFFAVVAILLYL